MNRYERYVPQQRRTSVHPLALPIHLPPIVYEISQERIAFLPQRPRNHRPKGGLVSEMGRLLQSEDLVCVGEEMRIDGLLYFVVRAEALVAYVADELFGFFWGGWDGT